MGCVLSGRAQSGAQLRSPTDVFLLVSGRRTLTEYKMKDSRDFI